MKDKEVGELWSLCNSTADDNIGLLGDMKRLIRKLVDETAFRGDESAFSERERKVFLRDTLRKYGIDPKKWHW